MEQHESTCLPAVAFQPPVATLQIETAGACRARLLRRLLEAKGRGREWITKYEIPGRKML